MIALAKLVASRQKTCAQYGLGKDSKKDSEGIPKGRNTTGLRDESQRDSGGIPGFQKIRELIVSSQFSKTKFIVFELRWKGLERPAHFLCTVQ